MPLWTLNKTDMSSWTVDKLVTAQVVLFCYKPALFYFTIPARLNMFHPNPTIKQRSCRKAMTVLATLIQCIRSYLLLWPSTVKQNQSLVSWKELPLGYSHKPRHVLGYNFDLSTPTLFREQKSIFLCQLFRYLQGILFSLHRENVWTTLRK